jgi:hypothetical protein
MEEYLKLRKQAMMRIRDNQKCVNEQNRRTYTTERLELEKQNGVLLGGYLAKLKP